MYKDIRGTGEVLYGAATRCGLIHTNSRRDENRAKDGLLIGLRQNLFAYLRLKALIGIIRKTPDNLKIFKSYFYSKKICLRSLAGFFEKKCFQKLFKARDCYL